MDHSRDYWFKHSYEQQKKDISLEFSRLTEFWGKHPRNVKLLMNRCIKYTKYSIDDPKNTEHIEELQAILECEKQYKEDCENLELEKRIKEFFDRKKVSKNAIDIALELFDAIDKSTPQSKISIIQYDNEDHPIASFTGTIEEVCKSIETPTSYYYRVAVLNQNTTRERIGTVHFGIKTTCVGGLSFDLDEAIHRYLNYQIKSYEKGNRENFFYTLCHVEWYTRLLSLSRQLSSDKLDEELKKLFDSFPTLFEVKDLNALRKKSGIYILVLDKYNVCYVGQSNDITRRIMAHWSRSNYFTDIGIDLFKPYDTTRIFAILCDERDIDKTEYQIIEGIDPKYTLNILSGGTIDYHIDNNIPLIKESVEESDVFEEIMNTHKTAMEMEKLFIVE